MDVLVEQAINLDQWNPGKIDPMKNRYTIIGNDVVVELTLGKHCVIDIDCMFLLENHIWRCRGERGRYEALNEDYTRMHRMIIGDSLVSNIMRVAHISGNALDNRRSNLCSVQKGAKVKSHNKSGVTGISWNKQKRKWASYISINGERMNRFFLFKEDAVEWRREQELNMNI